jgi:hypothetical protein
MNPSITPEFVEKHIDKPWDWGKNGLSRNPMEFVEKHIDKPWDWGELSRNPSITLEFVEKHIHKPWEWGYGGLSSNPSITPEFVEKHIDKEWNWGVNGLSRNTFKDAIKQEKAARVIQKGCHNWLWKPLCKDGTVGIGVRLMMKDINKTLRVVGK